MTNITKSYGMHMDTIHADSFAIRSTSKHTYGKICGLIFTPIFSGPKTSTTKSKTGINEYIISSFQEETGNTANNMHGGEP